MRTLRNSAGTLGPPGYICTGSPDTTGHAYRGHCLKSTGGAFAASLRGATNSKIFFSACLHVMREVLSPVP